MNFLAAFCSSMPADWIRKMNGAAEPSRMGTSGASRSIQALSMPSPAEGRHQVFDGPHLDPVHFETGAHAGIANQHGLGGNIHRLRQIDATEDDAGIRGCRAQGQIDLDAAMQADT